MPARFLSLYGDRRVAEDTDLTPSRSDGLCVNVRSEQRVWRLASTPHSFHRILFVPTSRIIDK